MKTALITGISGQDGAYLAKFLLDKGYEVFGTYRRLSTPNFWRLQYLDIFENTHKPKKILEVGCGTGNYTKILLERGYEVTAVDAS